MAILEKSRARKPLAENRLSLSWSNYDRTEGVRYNLHVNADEDAGGHRYTLKLSPAEALAFVNDLARHETCDPHTGAIDRRSTVERLRALADKLEAQGELQRMALTG